MRAKEVKPAPIERHDWDGRKLTVCSVCGYAATDEALIREHERISGHDTKQVIRGSDELPAIEISEVNE